MARFFVCERWRYVTKFLKGEDIVNSIFSNGKQKS